MIMKKTINPPKLENEKQTKPMAGETAPEDARLKGAIFAAQEKAKLKSGQQKN
jgi:hypothetical protein